MALLLRFLTLFVCIGALAPLSAQTLPPGCALDTAYAPFHYGVASFDPDPDRVFIWTRAEAPPGFPGLWEITWQVASDSAFTNILDQGTGVPGPALDWTLAVDVSGLQPYTYYYYRFISPGGADTSRVGRTKTAPGLAQAQNAKFAITSCSSLFSGYFNAYRHIGNRSDIDLVVHVGDYIYDFVDADEEERVPTPYPTVPLTQDEWRARHKMYLADPDLRLARQNHPFTVAWDNHDFDYNSATHRDTGALAFLEYVPMRLEAPGTEPTRIYRRRAYGGLIDLMMIDMDSYQNHGAPAAEDTTALGANQLAWLKQNLASSTARWKIIGSQKLFGHWQVPNIPGVSTPIADAGWNEYAAERDSIYAFLQANPVENLIVVSGDAHLTFVLDLPRDPSNGYNSNTGAGSLGVEFLPTSISRGNLDEMVGTDFLTNLANNANLAANPHHRYCHFSKHGYGVLTVTPDSAVAEVNFLPILSVSNSVEQGHRNVVLHGENHWKRATPVGVVEAANPNANLQSILLRPNPVTQGSSIEIFYRQLQSRPTTVRVFLLATGQEVPCPSEALPPVNGLGYTRLQPQNLASGLYLVQVSDGQSTLYTRFLIGN